jgi:ECF-type riboflavin transporter S component/squalene-hopene cyclase-like protein/prenyltransferase/squalene oxidase-like repeat protein
VTWQLGSTLVVMAALAAGFAWYERGRPTSKLVTLVAALAGLAVAGRVVFAPIPNVQATTDVVLLAGYALGAGPGFAVGAIAALVSNFFLGQGPWTPWQMLGWGMVGVTGAALARAWAIRGRDRLPPRLLLAFVCALAGFAFGAWMDLFTMVVFTAERSFDTYLVVASTGLPFNIAHAVGNALLCLMLGPGFLHLLIRFRRRFEVEWAPAAPASAQPAVTAGVLLVAALSTVSLGAAVGSDTAEAAGVRSAVRYLERSQNTDGGFGNAPGQRSNELVTGWTVLGLEAAGRHPLDVRRAGRSPVDFIRPRARSGDIGELERTILALRAAGLSARSFGGTNLVGRLLSRQRRDGSFERLVNLTSFGILAMRAAGLGRRHRLVRKASGWLARRQNRDGGFSVAGGGSSDVDDTGAALQALAASGKRRSRVTHRALAFLRQAHNPDGGFGQFPRSRSNAQSSAWAVQGAVAAGRDPHRLGGRRKRSPLAYLSSLQQGNGSFRYSRTSQQTPVWVTAQVVTALERRPFPIRRVRRAGMGPRSGRAFRQG